MLTQSSESFAVAQVSLCKTQLVGQIKPECLYRFVCAWYVQKCMYHLYIFGGALYVYSFEGHKLRSQLSRIVAG